MFSVCKRTCIAATLSLTTALVCFAQQPEGKHDHHPVYITFSVPDSTQPSYTQPTAINSALTVTGYYSDQVNGPQSFVRDISGKFTTFTVGTVLTEAMAINDRGEITGIYQNVSGEQGGFVRSPKGVITTFTPGGADGDTTPTGINDDGMVTGFYATNNGGALEPYLGFVRYPDGGIVTFNANPGMYTSPEAINATGATTGAYNFENNTQVGGFVREPDGYLTTIQYQQGIVPTSINARGTVAGWYGPNSGGFQAFVRSPHGKITPIQLPGQVSVGVAAAPRVNRWDEVTGSYTVTNLPTGPSQITYGFLRSCDGKIKTLAVPRKDVFSTAPADINKFGVITGSYETVGGTEEGFIRIP